MRLITGLVVVLCAASSFAQVIYEPVQYQYKSGGRSYYYGGADARVHMTAAWPMAFGADWGRSNGLAFHSANVHTHREVASERPRVYTDALPLRNAYIHGFTANDARNEAMANVPLYWRKREMINRAIPLDRGHVVPAQWHRFADAGTIEIKPYRSAKPYSGKGAVIVIPKELLKKKLFGQEEELMTLAD
jgi:hypothetical protein